MLSPPDGLPEDVLRSVLVDQWGVSAASMVYRPVGFGSHHWEVGEPGGARWFLTADDLAGRRFTLSEPLDTAFGRLRAALAAATELRAHGRDFVVAPVPTLGGEPVAWADGRYGVALYPFVDGQSYEWGEFESPANLRSMLDMVIAVHTAPASPRAGIEDFHFPHRDELDAGLGGAATTDCGPYAAPAAALLVEHAAPIRRWLARYDELAARGRAQPSRAVLTHGEPHPGNTMRTDGGWLLIDWDTALVAPPERDLWGLVVADEAVVDTYAEATGVRPLPSMLELYRIRWDLADLGSYVSHFGRAHHGNADDEKSWDILGRLVAYLAG